ncbi:cytochrome c oxidase subunit 3 [Alkalihalobacillus sp. CinArs1]|uniref:cytochrome c oxidase subunit 3 n=1 Tax=Alkalihalobacillus sp. CinArs1 TaxID=2995314 RepID=UPI0022DD7564|nr:cytochrome c oxidase subunit 3 [Alkalihalobacillus sp. CinArs1]
MPSLAEKNLFSDHHAQMNILAFWFLIGAEVVVFGCLFGIYVSVQELTNNGPGAKELFNLSEIIVSTIVLLSSSFTCALGVYTLKLGKKTMTLVWFLLTISLGLGFVILEGIEFMAYVAEGATISSSPFLGAFYMLLGTHGAHVLFGIVWIFMLLIQLMMYGITKETAPKLFIASLYWHFIDVVWVFIFTVVYLLGKV